MSIEEQFRRTIEKDPDNYQAHTGLGFLLLEFRKPSEAKKHFMESLHILGRQEEQTSLILKEKIVAMLMLANCSLQMDDQESGLEFYEAGYEEIEAIQKDYPDYDLANALPFALDQYYYSFGVILKSRQRNDESIRMLRKAVAVNPVVDHYWKSLASVYTMVNRDEEASLCMDQTVFPNELGASRTACALLSKANLWDEAEERYRQTIEKYPTNAGLLLDFSKLLITMSSFDEALEQLQLVTEYQPHNPEAWWQLCRVQCYTTKTTEALKTIDTILELDSSHQNALKMRGAIETSNYEQIGPYYEINIYVMTPSSNPVDKIIRFGDTVWEALVRALRLDFIRHEDIVEPGAYQVLFYGNMNQGGMRNLRQADYDSIMIQGDILSIFPR